MVSVTGFYHVADAYGKGPVVGLLSTRHSTYEGEYNTARNIEALLLKFGAEKVVLIDYNEIVEALQGSNKPIFIERSLLKILSKNEIDRIFIPGNYYNIVSQPLPPVPNRQLVTDAVVKIMGEKSSKKDLKLLAICGGLQGVLHAQKVEIRKLKDMLGSLKSAEVHISSMPDPRSKNAPLSRIEAIEGSKLGAMVSKARGDGGMFCYLPDAHREAVYASAENIAKLRRLGYKVSAISSDGMIEGLEDSRGNMLLQMHPEYLLMGMDEKTGKNDEVDISIRVAEQVIRDFLS